MSCESLVGNDSFAFLKEIAICKRASAYHRGLDFSDIRCLPEDPSNVEISRIWNAKLYGQIRSPRACVLHSGNKKRRFNGGRCQALRPKPVQVAIQYALYGIVGGRLRVAAAVNATISQR